jgi:hypothetical protein
MHYIHAEVVDGAVAPQRVLTYSPGFFFVVKKMLKFLLPIANFVQPLLKATGSDGFGAYTWDNQAWAEGALSYPGRAVSTRPTDQSTVGLSSQQFRLTKQAGGGRQSNVPGNEMHLVRDNSREHDPFNGGTAYV